MVNPDPLNNFYGLERWEAPSCQPYGAALLIDNDGVIVTLTQTTGSLLGAPDAKYLLGDNISLVCPPLFDMWQDRVEGIYDARDWTRLEWAGLEFDARAVPHENAWLVDIWPAGTNDHGWEDVQEVAAVVREWLQSPSFDINHALTRYREWLGFDSVMVYQIGDDGDGVITAQSSCRDEQPSLLGLHYPISILGSYHDALGIQNVARNIVDIDAPSTRWITIRPEIDALVAELSVCREADAMHHVLMKNLGFRSCLMLPLVMDGKVKGLLVSYNEKPTLLSGITLLVARTYAQSLSLKINEHNLRSIFENNARIEHAQYQVEQYVSSQGSLVSLINEKPQLLLNMMNANGLIYKDKSTSMQEGVIPDISEQSLSLFIQELDARTPSTIFARNTGLFATDHLKAITSIDFDFKQTAGVLAMRLPNQAWLLLFRSEMELNVNSGAIFSTFLTRDSGNISGFSRSWTDLECNAAVSVVKTVCSKIYNDNNVSSPELCYDLAIAYRRDGRIIYLNKPARSLLQRMQLLNRSDLTIYDLSPNSKSSTSFIQRAMAEAYHDGFVEGTFVFSSNTKNVAAVSLKGRLIAHKRSKDYYFTWGGFDITEMERARYEFEFLQEAIPVAQMCSSEQYRIELDQTISSVQQEDGQLFGALYVIDLDGVRLLLDKHNASFIDVLTKTLYRRLLSSLGSNIKVFHLDNDEYAVLVPRFASEPNVHFYAEQLLRIIKRPVLIDGIYIVPSACIGIALIPFHGSNAGDLTLAVDDAMYAAKRSGRGQIKMYDPDFSLSGSSKFHQAGELRRAIQQNELRAFLQPQFNAQTGKLIGAEALVRWQHPEQGLLPPGRFIQLAEDTGLIDRLGEWMLRDTARQISTWPTYWQETLKVSVNASVRQLRDKAHFLHVVDTTLQHYGINPRCFEIEITETIWMGGADEAIQTLQALRDRGISIAIDDFGTGYSNIAYLQSFPVDKLKFDRSFVVSGTTKPQGRSILKAMVQLAEALNVETLAEGVETKEQEDMLLHVGIQNVQGFGYAKPMPEHQFVELLQKIDALPNRTMQFFNC